MKLQEAREAAQIAHEHSPENVWCIMWNKTLSTNGRPGEECYSVTENTLTGQFYRFIEEH